ncbi:MAG: PTS sugar transporter subunit IIA [Spirochaetales bacterium]
MSKSLAQFLEPATIKLTIEAKKKSAIIHELVETLGNSERVGDIGKIEALILEREALATTGIGGGIAIPHCLSEEVDETVMGFGRRVPGAKFDAVDRQPVQLFFVIVGPVGAHNEHLRLLSKLSRHLHDSDFRAGLLAAPTPEAVIDLFKEQA